ncbi:MAG TPA: GrpB family protein [Anaerolineales bacterium]
MSTPTEDWQETYESERDRLIDALGKVGEGGIVEAIQHVGATSVPGMYGSPCVDIGLTVWPFPLEEGPRSRLETLGYQMVAGYEEGPEQRFRHHSSSFRLYLMEAGSERWLDLVLVRDYLRHEYAACEEVSLKKRDALVDRSQLFEDLLPAAQQWWIGHHQFSPVEAVAGELKNVSFPWYISSGWALDLFLGGVNRVHHDVDVVVSRSAQMELQKHLTGRGWKLVTPFEKHLEVWPPHMQLELPRHQVHAHRGDDFIDFLLTDLDGVWKYRREPSIVRSLERISLRTESGIPYLSPELVLLFKSKNTSNQERLKDQPDFERTLPHLEPERRAWLRWALVATSPDHPWIERLV